MGSGSGSGEEDSGAEEDTGEVSGVGVEEDSGAEEEVSGTEEEAETLLEEGAGPVSAFSPQAVRLSSSTAARRIARVFKSFPYDLVGVPPRKVPGTLFLEETFLIVQRPSAKVKTNTQKPQSGMVFGSHPRDTP